MCRFPSAILLALCAVMLFPHPAPTQDKPATAAAAPAVTGARGEFLAELAFYEQRYTRLAEAIPAAKYTWRPGRGSSFDRGSLRSHRSGELRHRPCFWHTGTSRRRLQSHRGQRQRSRQKQCRV